jgi:hypothetical protein
MRGRPLGPERWHQLEELFHAAHGLPPSERGRYLAEACGDDYALRAEVESLLRAEERSTTLPAAAPGRATPSRI